LESVQAHCLTDTESVLIALLDYLFEQDKAKVTEAKPAGTGGSSE
jgi:hypothetical protein